MFGKGLKTERKLEVYQAGLSYYPGPHYAARLISAYYNAGVQAREPLEKIFYFELARTTARNYLEQYPKEKELSKFYKRAQANLY